LNVAAPPVASSPASLEFLPESFWSVTYRRCRYAVAIGVSALIFATAGWAVASPPGEWGGVSLLVWQNHPTYALLVLALLLLVAATLCTFLVHPDSPHMGMYCALLGLGALSIRGGTVHILNVYAQETQTAVRIARELALECAVWTALLLLMDAYARALHDWFFTNTHWITRSRPDAGTALLRKSRLGYGVGVSLVVSRTLGTEKIKGWLAIPLAILWSSAIAMLLLFLFMQSQAKGQVFMACFVAFLVSTLCAYLAFPRVPILAFLLAVPVTAIAGYLWSAHGVAPYPGKAAFFAARALPIDYFAFGVPGEILGFYWALQWSLHSSLEE